MNWLTELITGTGIAHSILLLSVVIAIGLYWKNKDFRHFGDNMGFVFRNITGHFGLQIHPEVLHFMKEFELILFIYSIGMQVGPSFFSSFKKGGITSICSQRELYF